MGHRTIALGVAGSFLGGYVQNLIAYHSPRNPPSPATGIIGSSSRDQSSALCCA